jgi:hypothetical protein
LIFYRLDSFAKSLIPVTYKILKLRKKPLLICLSSTLLTNFCGVVSLYYFP